MNDEIKRLEEIIDSLEIDLEAANSEINELRIMIEVLRQDISDLEQ